MKLSAVKLTLIAACAGLLIFAYLAWGRASDNTAQVQAAQAARGDLQILIAAAGSLTPKETVDVGAQVSGQLETLLVDAGDEVEAGQLLAQIDATIAENQVEADRAQLKELKASYTEQEATVELADAALKRAELLREKDAISQADYETAMAELKVAKARLVQLEAQIERQNSTLKSGIAELEYTKIYAPMTGTVTSLAAAEGQTLNANQTAPTILTIADLSVMTVEADVSEADVLRVAPGQQAYFTTLGDSDTKWQVTVRQILPQPEVVNDVVLYKALLDVDNPDRILRSEMTVQVFFIVGQATDAVIVPLTALKDPPADDPARKQEPQPMGGAEPEAEVNMLAEDATAGTADNAAESAAENAIAKVVFVIDKKTGKPQPRPVLVGLQTRAQAEIISGLEPGDTVVTGTIAAPSSRTQQSSNSTSRRGPPPFLR